MQGFRNSIPVCPANFDRAFANGSQCCHYSENYKTTVKVAPRLTSLCPSGESAPCPDGSGCEDNPPSCFEFFELEGFGKDYDGFYNFDTKHQYEASKQLYVLEPDFQVQGDKCIWWFRPCRRWWLGHCEHVGTNTGFAYIDADVVCPHPEEQRWMNPETGKYFVDIRNYSAERCKHFADGTAVCGATSTSPLSSVASNGENAVVVNNRYVEMCSWRFSNGAWSCIETDRSQSINFPC